MNNLTKVNIGVDVSKNKLDIYIRETKKHFIVTNDVDGLNLFMEKLSQHSVRCIVCESSGGYENLLLQMSTQHNYAIAQVNAKRIKAFIHSRGKKAKTDKIDAQMIADFAVQYELTSPKSLSIKLVNSGSDELNNLVKRREELKRITISEKLRKEHNRGDSCNQSVDDVINFLELQMTAITKKINMIIESNEKFCRQAEIITSIPGMGSKTASTLIAELPELGTVSNKEIAALLGVAPYTNESGKYKGHSSIYGGRSIPRNVLYMATLSAVRCNQQIREFYQRLLAKGKKAKVALVAAMRKLIVIINTMVRNNTMWIVA